ncbi:MAG: DNA polymerase III subunit gamma/tau [Chlorobiaceae bacterium]|nr:DNA polymerase III subunit gamma/tau [Chlorobiaceae bacterium]
MEQPAVSPLTQKHKIADRPAAQTEEIDLAGWQKKFSGFTAGNTHAMPAKALPSTPPGGESISARESFPDIETLKVEWHQFLDSIMKTDQQLLAMHLQSCELVSLSPRGEIVLSCCRKLSWEELRQDAKHLEKALAAFYELPLVLRIVYDAEKDACTKEKTIFTLFQELSQSSEVVRFLIREFGGELLY